MISYHSISNKSVVVPKKLLRINTMDDFRKNTPSPPFPPKNSPIKTFNKNIHFSPKPKSIIKLIETPTSGNNKMPKRKKLLEKTIENVVENMMEQLCYNKSNKKIVNKLAYINILKDDENKIDDENEIDDLELININNNLLNNLLNNN